MFKKIINFIKYNNAFSIGFTIIFVGLGTAFAASPEMRDYVVSSEEVVRSIDNSFMISTDLDNFDFGLKIETIQEDGQNYYILYNYKSLEIIDYVWQEVQKENNLVVSKEGLMGRDLGLYVADQLGEVINYEQSYLREVKDIEQKNGLTQKIVATQYDGLVGRFLDTKEKTFPGYQPVVARQPEPEKPIVYDQQIPSGSAENIQDIQGTTTTYHVAFEKESVQQMVEEILAQKQKELDYQASHTATTSIDVTGIGSETTTTEPISVEPTTTEPVIEPPAETEPTTTEPIIEPPTETPTTTEPTE
jgi:hypothetical protein